MPKRTLLIVLLLACSLPLWAKPKKKMYNNSAQELFTAALRTARERHVITYVDEKMMMFTFQTGRSIFTKGFIANASIEPQAEDRAVLVINVQMKDDATAFGAGDRMADKFFAQVNETLAGQVTQAAAIHPEQPAIEVPPPKAVPPEPSLTAPPTSDTAPPTSGKGVVILTASPDHADVIVDGSFVGNAPVNLKLAPGKHTISVSAHGYQTFSREINVLADSEVSLAANLEK